MAKKPSARDARSKADRTGRSGARKWSRRVTERSHALDLEERVFAKSDPQAIACSLKRSAERSGRRKAEPFRSAMSMLTFYINRAGKHLGERRLRILERAKAALREQFKRGTRSSSAARSS